MSLVGNLEDLSLGDILQIVSLSRKSGVLSLESRGLKGEVAFRRGRVVRASSPKFESNLGEILVRRGVIDDETLGKALAELGAGQEKRLDAILADRFGVSPESIEQAAREQIETIVHSFLGWTKGAFSFDLGEPEEDGADSLQVVFEKGLNPQWLAMEGCRILDEKLYRGECRGIEEATLQDPKEPAVGSAGCSESAMFDLGAELIEEFEKPQEIAFPSKGSDAGGLRLLKGMLQELCNPIPCGGISLLVLRFASELMNRAVMFLVRDEGIVGLGQFGVEAGGGADDARIRRMRIPIEEESVFRTAFVEKIPRKTRLGSGRWDAYLRDELGGNEPTEIFLGPIVANDKVVALIYGDNLPEEEGVGPTESLEIFLAQAGLAMEKALLEERLEEKGQDARGARGPEGPGKAGNH